jgi:hypothetical protein
VSFWQAVWRIGLPLLGLASAAGAVWFVFSERPDRFSRPRGWQWIWGLVRLRTAGEAALGDNRWWFERAWKGTAALLLAVAVVVGAWRHYRWRSRTRQKADVATSELGPPA